MPRYEFREGTSNKFWEIELSGTSFTTTFGRIGTDGQSSTKTWKNEQEAKRQYDKIVEEKVGKGYALVGGGKAKAAPAKAAAAPPPPKVATKKAAAAPPPPKSNRSVASAPAGGAARYEFTEGGSSKFWEISLEANSFTTRFGRIGTDGQVSTKLWKNEDEAKRQYDKIVEEKVGKGYVLVGTSAPSNAGASKKGGRNPELEKAIEDAPDDDDAYLVYGDWLAEQGDPLGELVAVDAGLAKKPKDAALAKRRQALVDQNRAAWVGILDKLDDDVVEVDWKNGFVTKLALGGDGEDSMIEESAASVYSAIRKLATTRFIRDLEIRMFDDEDGEPSYADLLRAMDKQGLPRTLRRLAFDVKSYQVSWTDLGDISKLYPQLERLEELFLHVGKMKLGEIVLPSLKSFEVHTGGFSKANLKSVLGATWPNLEKLVLYFGTDEYGCDCKVSDLAPILDGKGLGKVRHLGLANSEFANELAERIPTAKIVKQLEVLDLSKGTMNDEGAQKLVDAAKSLSHLKTIDLTNNYLSDEMIKTLTKTFGKRVVAAEQQDGDGDSEDRYVMIAE